MFIADRASSMENAYGEVGQYLRVGGGGECLRGGMFTRKW